MTYEEYCRLYEELEQKAEELKQRARELLRELHDVDPIEGFAWLDVYNIDQYDVLFAGTETWSRGGYRDYSFDIPTQCLFDPLLWKDEVNNRALLREKREQEKIKLASDKEIREAENRRQLYEKLKKEFE